MNTSNFFLKVPGSDPTWGGIHLMAVLRFITQNLSLYTSIISV